MSRECRILRLKTRPVKINGLKIVGREDMFCTKCGTRNEETNDFCVECGTALRAERTRRIQEEIVMQVNSVSDRMWGGLFDLILTDRRIAVDYRKGLTSAQTTGIYAAGGVLGLAIARRRLHKDEIALDQDVDVEAIIKSHRKNYAIQNDDVKKIKLRRKSFTIGCSDLKIESTGRKVHWVFKRDKFDDVSSTLAAMFQDKVEVK